jgi:hypothetical protein
MLRLVLHCYSFIMSLSHTSCIAWLLFSVLMPHDIVWQAIYTISCPLGHFRESLCFGLVLKRVARKVDARTVDVCFDNDVDATDAVQGNLFILVAAPVAHQGHVFAIGGELLVTFCEDGVLGEF